MPHTADIHAFFDTESHTFSYLIIDPVSREAAVIDPVLDYAHHVGLYSTASADAIIAAAQDMSANIVYVLETHVHADHLSSASYIRARTGAKLGIGEGIREVQQIFRPMFNQDRRAVAQPDFDLLFMDGEAFSLGSLQIEVMHTPGHTPACVSYRVGDAVFVGDTLFMPDYGTARTDFPGGCARTLYRSIQRLLCLPEDTRLFMCHDYLPETRMKYLWESTVAEQKTKNIHINNSIGETDFVRVRQERDAHLRAPELLLPSIQVNIRAGHLPDIEMGGFRYLKIPLKPANPDQDWPHD